MAWADPIANWDKVGGGTWPNGVTVMGPEDLTGAEGGI